MICNDLMINHVTKMQYGGDQGGRELRDTAWATAGEKLDVANYPGVSLEASFSGEPSGQGYTLSQHLDCSLWDPEVKDAKPCF